MKNNRDYKKFVAGSYYHIYNRGTAKMNIFPEKEDFMFFINRLRENLFPELIKLAKRSKDVTYIRKFLESNQFDLIAYCLMPTHYHLLIFQIGSIPISKLIQKVCTSYSKYFNKKYNRVGGVFQDEFKAVLIESDEQLRWTIDYIHNNPVRAGLVDHPSKFPFSSYLEYQGFSYICKPFI